MPNPLTDLERRVLEYLVEYLRTNTYQPSIREIGREFSIKSTKTVSELLQSLADKGWIERDPSRSRGVRLLGVELKAESVSVPVYNALDDSGPATHFQLDRQLVPHGSSYMIVMEGNHLAEDCVRPGDLLVIEPAEPSSLEDGDLVVAAIGVQSSVRRCSRRDGALVLEPAGSGEAALPLTPRQAISILRGRVATIIRRVRASAVDASAVASAAAT